MKTIERLRELEKAATPVYEKPTELENNTTNGFRGDVRIWNRDIAGDCVAVFRSSPKARATADHYIATRNALPALLAVVEAQAAEIENAREFRRRCCEYTLSYLDPKGERVMDMERRLIAGYSKLKENTDAALRALEGGE